MSSSTCSWTCECDSCVALREDIAASRTAEPQTTKGDHDNVCSKSRPSQRCGCGRPIRPPGLFRQDAFRCPSAPTVEDTNAERKPGLFESCDSDLGDGDVILRESSTRGVYTGEHRAPRRSLWPEIRGSQPAEPIFVFGQPSQPDRPFSPPTGVPSMSGGLFGTLFAPQPTGQSGSLFNLAPESIFAQASQPDRLFNAPTTNPAASGGLFFSTPPLAPPRSATGGSDAAGSDRLAPPASPTAPEAVRQEREAVHARKFADVAAAMVRLSHDDDAGPASPPPQAVQQLRRAGNRSPVDPTMGSSRLVEAVAEVVRKHRESGTGGSGGSGRSRSPLRNPVRIVVNGEEDGDVSEDEKRDRHETAQEIVESVKDAIDEFLADMPPTRR